MNWQFRKFYARCSAGLWYISAKREGTNWFNITDSMHITRARKMLEDAENLNRIAGRVYEDRYGQRS